MFYITSKKLEKMLTIKLWEYVILFKYFLSQQLKNSYYMIDIKVKFSISSNVIYCWYNRLGFGS